MKTKFYSSEEVINNFDFISVHKYMTEVNWTWFNKGVPSVETMKSTARVLLMHAAYDKLYESELSTSTGGFTAKRNEDGSLELYFNFNK